MKMHTLIRYIRIAAAALRADATLKSAADLKAISALKAATAPAVIAALVTVIAAAAVITVTAVLPAPLDAAEYSRGGTFLPMGWDARGEGMGHAATILIRDDRSVFWNPANLTFLSSPRLSIGTMQPVPDLEAWYSVLSAGTGLLDIRSHPDLDHTMHRFGVGVMISHLGLELAGGSKWNEGTFGLSAAFAPNHYNSIGVTFKVMKSWNDLSDADATVMSVDFGWTALVRGRLWLAVVGRNFASAVTYPNRDDEIDPVWNIAAAYERIAGRVSLEFDTVFKNGAFNRFLFGGEVMLVRDLIFVTGGVDYRLTEGERTIPSFGFGSMFCGIEIALAFTFDPEDAFGHTTRISVGYSL